MKAFSIALVLCFTVGISLAEGRAYNELEAGKGAGELFLGAHMDTFPEPKWPHSYRRDSGPYGPGWTEMKEGEVAFHTIPYGPTILFDQHQRVKCITVISLLYRHGDTPFRMRELYGEPEEVEKRGEMYDSYHGTGEMTYHHYWTKGISFKYSRTWIWTSIYYPIVPAAIESQTWGKIKALFR